MRVKCPIESCPFETEDLPAEIVVPLLNIHAVEHSQPRVPVSRGPKLNPPTIDVGVDEETWNAFVRRWETFKLGSDIDEQQPQLSSSNAPAMPWVIFS